MTSPIRIAVQLQPQQADFDGMRRALRVAEEPGVDTPFDWDHFHPLYDHPDRQPFERLPTLAAPAPATGWRGP